MLKQISKRTTFILAVVGASIIGGAGTSLVKASIPSTEDGRIAACYQNNAGDFNPKGSLRVVDSDQGETCTAQETALSIEQPTGKVISKRTLVPQGQQQTVLELPNFGEFMMVCGSDSFIYHNTTGHEVQYDYGILTAGNSANLYWPSEVRTYQFGFTQDGVDHLATLAASATLTEQGCLTQLQTTTSQ